MMSETRDDALVTEYLDRVRTAAAGLAPAPSAPGPSAPAKASKTAAVATVVAIVMLVVVALGSVAMCVLGALGYVVLREDSPVEEEGPVVVVEEIADPSLRPS
jgi:hypothetical protein